MVPPAGFEPAIFALKGRRPRPLDDGDSAEKYNRPRGILTDNIIIRENGPVALAAGAASCCAPTVADTTAGHLAIRGARARSGRGVHAGPIF